MQVEGSEDSDTTTNLNQGPGPAGHSSLATLDSCLSVVESVELFLSSEQHFSKNLRRIYERASMGSSSNSDRHISFDIFLECVTKLHSEILMGPELSNQLQQYPEYLPLQLYLPEPDTEFICNSLELLRSTQIAIEDNVRQGKEKQLSNYNSKSDSKSDQDQSDQHLLPPGSDLSFNEQVPTILELQKDGLEDYEQFEELVQAVYVQMAHCAELMQERVGREIKMLEKEGVIGNQDENANAAGASGKGNAQPGPNSFERKVALWSLSESMNPINRISRDASRMGVYTRF